MTGREGKALQNTPKAPLAEINGRRRVSGKGGPVLRLLILATLLALVPLAVCDGAVVTDCSQCPICCVTSTDSSGSSVFTCSDNELTCKLKPRTDFRILLTTLIIILGFAFGIPIIIGIIDFLVIRRPCHSKMSICECCVNYLCLCICCKKSEKTTKTLKRKKSTKVDAKDNPEEAEKL